MVVPNGNALRWSSVLGLLRAEQERRLMHEERINERSHLLGVTVLGLGPSAELIWTLERCPFMNLWPAFAGLAAAVFGTGEVPENEGARVTARVRAREIRIV